MWKDGSFKENMLEMLWYEIPQLSFNNNKEKTEKSRTHFILSTLRLFLRRIGSEI